RRIFRIVGEALHRVGSSRRGTFVRHSILLFATHSRSRGRTQLLCIAGKKPLLQTCTASPSHLLELNVLHVYFVGDVAAYRDWQNSDYRVPHLRGSDGLLRKLRRKGAIDETISNEVDDLYDKLSGTI